jgi:DNA polymerase III sliding clamp (beta) subunit (PCNA family)
MILNKYQKQELLTKHAKFFAADKNATNKIFQGIHYLNDGTACVTDTHILLRIKDVLSAVDVSSVAVVRSVHAITGAELEGVFPSNAIENLLTWNQENQMTLDTYQIEAFTKHAKIAQMIGKELKSDLRLVKLVLCRGNAFLQVSDQGVELNVQIGATSKDQEETWSFNPDYLYNTLNLFKSAGSSELVIKFKSNGVNPIVFKDEENGIVVLVSPVRTSAEVRDGCS